MDCTVEVCDLGGLRHSVQVDADSLYEAAVKGIAALRKSAFPVGVMSPMEITIRVRPPETVHVVQFGKIDETARKNIAPGATKDMRGLAYNLAPGPTGDWLEAALARLISPFQIRNKLLQR